MGAPLTITFDDGPRAGDTEVLEFGPAVVIGDGSAKGVYQRTDEIRDGMIVFRWQPLSNAEVEALLRGDIRANQTRPP
jgi:hypothetical protein